MLLAVLGLLAGCRETAPHPAPAPEAGATRAYRCADGFRFVTRTEPQRVWLFLPERTTSLPQVPTGSGVHYTDGRVVLRARGEDAVLELNGRTHGRCVNQPDEAVWEDARLRGVDFRAAGENPRWWLEVDEAREILFVSQDGARHRFSVGTQATDAGGLANSYEVYAPGHRLRVEIEEGPCHAPTSGETFPASVAVRLDDEAYRGCGRPLK